MIWAAIQEWLWPKELRIRAGRIDSAALLVEFIRSSKAAALRSQSGPPGRPLEGAPDLRFLARVATHLWRLRAKLIDQNSGTPRTEVERAFRHFEAAWDALIDAGICVIDLQGQPFDPGMTVKALASEPVPGLTREVVLQTVKPTVMLNGALIQMGEVVVGVPERTVENPNR